MLLTLVSTILLATSNGLALDKAESSSILADRRHQLETMPDSNSNIRRQRLLLGGVTNQEIMK